MTLCRALVLVGVLTVVPLEQAGAQFGGMPGMPGGPGFGAPAPAAPPPACQQLIVLRDDVEKNGKVIQAANQRKAPVGEACKLFKAFLAVETKFVKGLEDSATVCGVPPEAIANAKAGHNRAAQLGKQVCEAAAQGGRPAGPSLSDALGSTPTVPDATTTKQGRGGAFDTLTGSPLTR
jgi:hypothetical protein